ncbi:MAG: serine hydrolase [Gemmatimonadetes bacterium]|nr:serine hydrolase [Gemmatimonadota bacterium]
MRRPLVLLLTLALTAHAAAAQDRGAQVRELDAFIQKGMKDWHLPGLSVAVVVNDSVLLAKGYGVRSIAAPAPVDAQTEFGIMSTTKAMTTMALAMLVDEGKLSWNDRVTRWLPGFEFSEPFITKEATVRDLLTHDLGVPNADLLWARGDLSRDEILRRVRYLPQAYPLRGGFTYQNVMYGAAGEIVARASGMSWEDFVTARIFRPLGMAHTYPSYARMHAAERNVSAAHYRIRDTLRVIDDETVDVLPSAGAVWSTADDIAKWVRFLLDSARVDGKRLVSERNFRLLLKPQSFVTAEEFYPTAQLTKPHWTTYGLGWFEQDFRGRFLAFHTGSLDGRTAIIGLLPDSRVGVYVFGNADHVEFRHAVMLKTLDLFAGTNGQPARDWSADFLALYDGIRAKGDSARAAAAKQRIPGTRPSLPLEGYVGTYTHPAWGTLVVTLEKGTLHVQLGTAANARGPLEHWHYDTFHATLGDGRDGPATVQFVLGPDGKVAKALFGGSEDYAFVR